ncbi:unnamed protein product [Chondrus crispus]|uniref:Cytokinin riboside 5'-monophosphate phosphoribohydrolase n=1 Tax=Chondrus crispus TaxID=2769 RepID=R7QLM2_CHOCR|nr:unnamed protein product [Chondrus crispus]CDF38678.1 unnamed protein product [Chondrus crispus]|eukprot:XP_005718583.1 unnamed protein product [Chondrus crispus]
MSKVKRVTVYSASTENVPPKFKQHAYRLGQLMAENGWVQCNGGGDVGLMGASSRGALDAGGVVDCVILKIFVNGPNPLPFRTVKVATTMADRKAGLRENADAFVALPGGLGTLDELAEVLCARQLSFHQRPIVLVNTDGYFDALLQFIREGIRQNFVSEHILTAMGVADAPEQAIEFIKNYRPFKIDKTRLESTEMNAASANE